MAKRFGFFNSINGDRKYLATDLSQAFDVGINTGLKADNADNFKIVSNANMQVKMMPGGAMIFGHYLLDEEEEIINLDMADAELNRIDRIVLRYDKFERSIKSAVIKGTAALTPVAPAALRTNEQFDLVLADVYIGKAVTSITIANITDMRESDLCGFIGVKGAVSQIDFDSFKELNGIVERGTNANGTYTKYADGTIICRKSNHKTITVGSGGAFSWVLPANIISKEDISVSVLSTYIDNLYHYVLSHGASTTSALEFYARPFTGGGLPQGTSVEVTLIAIGRWK